MTWHSTKTWAVGDLFVASDANQILRDDVQYSRDTVRVWSSFRDMGVWNNGGATAYSDFGGASYIQVPNYVKRQADSDLLIEAAGSAWLGAGGSFGNVRFGVNVGGTDYDGQLFYFNNLSEHETWFSEVRVTGLAAGTYNITLRAKSSAGTIGLNTDANDGASMDVQEASGN